MRPLVVYRHGAGFLTHLVAARTQKAAAEALQRSLYELKNYGGPTGNPVDIALATEAGEGVVLYQPNNRHSPLWREGVRFTRADFDISPDWWAGYYCVEHNKPSIHTHWTGDMGRCPNCPPRTQSPVEIRVISLKTH